MSRKKAAKQPATHGGKRRGAGAPRKYQDGTLTRSISMPPQAWDVLDEQRGDRSRGEHIALTLLKADVLRSLRLPRKAKGQNKQISNT